MGLTPFVQMFLLKYNFLAFLALHRERKRCGQVGLSSCYSQSEVVYGYQVLDLYTCSLKRGCQIGNLMSNLTKFGQFGKVLEKLGL